MVRRDDRLAYPAPVASAETSVDEGAVAGAQGPGDGVARHGSWFLRESVIWFLAGAAFLVYSAYALSRHRQFLTAGYDLGIFDQAVRAYSRFEAPIVTLKGDGYNLLGDHFHPILAALAPLYWVWDDPRMLQLAQAALVAASCLPMWPFLRRRFTLRVSAVITAAYLLCWPIQGAIDFDFHEVAFAAPLIALLIEGLDRRSGRLIVGSTFLLLLVKEDMGAFALGASAILLIRRQYRLAAVEGTLGLAGFWLATSVVIPMYAPSGRFAYWSYGDFGPDAPSMLRSLVTKPWDAVQAFFTPVAKTRTLLVLLLPVLALPLGSVYFILALPILAERFLSSREVLWGSEFHYSLVLAPVLFMAAADALAKVATRIDTERTRQRVVRGATGVMLAIALIGSLAHPQLYPLQRLFTGSALLLDDDARALGRVLPTIPVDHCVAVDDRIAPQLTARGGVVIAGFNDEDATWAVIDVSQDETSLDGPAPAEFVETLPGRGFRLVEEAGPIQVWTIPGAEPGPC